MNNKISYGHKKEIIFLFIIGLFLFSCIAYAVNQARIVIHPSFAISNYSDLYLRFVFSDIVSSHFPSLWFGPRFNINGDFSCAVMAGLTLKDKENTSKFSLFPVFVKNKWIIWNEFDYNFKYKNYYDFIIVRYSLTNSKNVKVGFDSENLFDKENFCYSIGPSIDFKFSNNLTFTITYFFRWMKDISDSFVRFYLIIS
jgi:hypothetical protein